MTQGLEIIFEEDISTGEKTILHSNAQTSNDYEIVDFIKNLGSSIGDSMVELMNNPTGKIVKVIRFDEDYNNYLQDRVDDGDINNAEFRDKFVAFFQAAGGAAATLAGGTVGGAVGGFLGVSAGYITGGIPGAAAGSIFGPPVGSAIVGTVTKDLYEQFELENGQTSSELVGELAEYVFDGGNGNMVEYKTYDSDVADTLDQMGCRKHANDNNGTLLTARVAA